MKQSGFNWTNTTKIEGNKTKAIFFRDKTSLILKWNFSSKLETCILLLGFGIGIGMGNLHIAPYHRSLAPGSRSPPELGFQLTSINQSIVFKCFKSSQMFSNPPPPEHGFKLTSINGHSCFQMNPKLFLKLDSGTTCLLQNWEKHSFSAIDIKCQG